MDIHLWWINFYIVTLIDDDTTRNKAKINLIMYIFVCLRLTTLNMYYDNRIQVYTNKRGLFTHIKANWVYLYWFKLSVCFLKSDFKKNQK